MFKISALVLLSVVGLATAQSGYTSLGCYSDSTSARALHDYIGSSSVMTIETCLSMCANVAGGPTALAGIEYGGECYCGNALLNEHAPISSSSCSMACSGSASETCGGPNALQLYQYAGSTFTSGSPSVLQSYQSWTYSGCYQDSSSAREIPNKQNIPVEDMTVETCLNACRAKGYTVAGLQYAEECWCGSSAVSSSLLQADSACSMQCTDNANEFCGAGNLNSVYTDTCSAVCPATITTNEGSNTPTTLYLAYQDEDPSSGETYCDYVDHSGYGYQSECDYNTNTGALIRSLYFGNCPSQTTCAPN